MGDFEKESENYMKNVPAILVYENPKMIYSLKNKSPRPKNRYWWNLQEN